eukprot:308917_1
MTMHIILSFIIFFNMPTAVRIKGPRPNGSRDHRPWTVDEIYQYNTTDDKKTSQQYVKCANCDDIRVFGRYKGHYSTCANVALPQVLPYYELCATESGSPEWEYKTKTNTRKRRSTKDIKSNRKAKKAKYASYWSSFGVQNNNQNDRTDPVIPLERKEESVPKSASPYDRNSSEWIVSVGQLENQYRGRGLSIKYVDNEDEEHPHQFTCFCGVCNASIANGRIYDWNDARSRINVKQCLDHHYNTDGNTHWSWANATKDEHGTISRAKIAYKAMVGQFMHNLEDGVGYIHWVKDMEYLDSLGVDVANKQHHEKAHEMILKPLYNVCLDYVSGWVKDPQESLGGKPNGCSLSFDKGTPVGYAYTLEYHRSKTYNPDGYPCSYSIYQHPITDEEGEGKEYTKATGAGLSANKRFVGNARFVCIVIELCGVCNVGDGLYDCDMVKCRRCSTWYHYGKESCEYHLYNQLLNRLLR